MTTIEAPPTEAPQAVAEKDRDELFQWNGWVHVGDGAEDCALAQATKAEGYKLGAAVPACEDAAHFHAWVRLPNPFQRGDIAEKAQAAKARKLRELRDPESDAAVVLTEELESLRDAEGGRDVLMDEIVEREYQQDLIAATQEVMDTDDPNSPEDGDAGKLYATIDQDIEELDRQDALPEDERDGYDRLKAHVDGYREAVEDAIERLRQRRRDALAERSWDDLIAMARRDRLEYIGNEAYLKAYNAWQMYTCTYKPKRSGLPSERVWGDVQDMRTNSAPEVQPALALTFNSLESAMTNSRRAKNS